MGKNKNLPTEEFVIRTSNGVQSIKLEQFPEIIERSLTRLETLDKMNKKAEQSAKDAKKKVETAKKAADSAKNAAISAVDKSSKVSHMSADIFHRKDAIEGLQDGHVNLANTQKNIADVVMEIADVQGNLSGAQTDTMEAIKASFELNKDITDISKYLFILGCSSITASQTVCRVIEMKLHNASEQEISDFARSELQSVVDNLRSQESMLQKQKQFEDDLDIYIDVVNRNKEKIEEHSKQLLKQKTVNEAYGKRLTKGEEHDVSQDKEIEAQANKDIEHDRRLDKGDEKDAEQDKLLEEQLAKDVEHDKAIAAGEQKDAEQDELLKAQAEKDREHDKAIAVGRQKNIEQDRLLKEQAEKGAVRDRRLDDVDARLNVLIERVDTLSEKNTDLERMLEVTKRNNKKRNWKTQTKRRR